MISAHTLAGDLVAFTAQQVELVVEHHMPGWRVPRVFAGHAVGPDVRADIAFTLGHLARNGVTEIAGTPVLDAAGIVLRDIDAARTHTFASYRVAETMARMPAIDDGSGNLRDACDSTAAIARLDAGELPRNYAAVLARCETARAALGFVAADDPTLAALVERTRTMLTENASGYVDDSAAGIGRYDIYTPDVYLFTEPLADRLGDAWTRGAASAADLVARVAATNGAAITWGRSTGALALCLTVELAGLVHAQDLGADRARWVGLAGRALDCLGDWFGPAGLITAHQHRSTYAYRGPFRRLQMTFDCLGKLADAAASLRAGPDTAGAPAFGDLDELVALDDRGAALWSYRSPRLAFVVPFVGGTVSDYLPAPRNPGLFEVPVDADLPTAVPFAIRRGRRYAPGGRPASIEHDHGRVITRHDGWLHTNQLDATDEPPLAGSRQATYEVDGRTLTVHERLTFDDVVPDVVGFHVAETAHRPLRIVFDAPDATATATSIDTEGIKEWRSFWAELPVVHQLDLDPRAEIGFSWSVTPTLRVLSSAPDHHYHRALYDPLVADRRVVDGRLAWSRIDDDAYLRDSLERWDQFHLHWPEWLIGPDEARHARFIDALERSGVRIVWTQHNLLPHSRDERLDGIYRRWAAAAGAVLHHSRVGEARVRDRYAFRDDAVHALVPHPHFGHLAPPRGSGQPADRIRLGVIGAPRPEKDVGLVIEAVRRCRRADVELHVFSLAPGDEVPADDARIHATHYEMVDRATYDERLAGLDAVVLPFGDGGQLLTTGTVGDVVAHGLPAIASPWPFLHEVLGDAAIPFGDSADDLARTIDGLTREQLDRAAAASRALQPRLAASRVANDLYAVLDALGTARL